MNIITHAPRKQQEHPQRPLIEIHAYFPISDAEPIYMYTLRAFRNTDNSIEVRQYWDSGSTEKYGYCYSTDEARDEMINLISHNLTWNYGSDGLGKRDGSSNA